MLKPAIESFLAKVDKSSGDCWIWTAYKNKDGYGLFRGTGTTIQAHRWSYEHFIGEIPEGLVIDHLCKTPLCVNPDHLEVVTQRENVLRGNSPSSRCARQTTCIRGHEYTEENTYRPPRAPHQRVCRACAKMRRK